MDSFPKTYKKLYFRMGVHWAPKAHIITNSNNKWKKKSEGEEFSVKRVILHEKYDPVKHTHDIALIELDHLDARKAE